MKATHLPLRKSEFGLFIFFMCLLCSTLTNGQTQTDKNITHQQLIWYGYSLTYEANPKWSAQADIQERHFINPIAQHQFVARGQLQYALGRGLTAAAGGCMFLQSPHNPIDTIGLIVPELRPHVELSYKQAFGKFSFDQRCRLEARFFHNTDEMKTELADGYDFGNYRLRYQLQFTLPIWKITDQMMLKLKVSDELHLNIGKAIIKNVFDQNRIYGGIQLQLMPTLALEMGYLNWFQQRATGSDYYDRDITRFTIIHKITRGNH